MSRIRKQARTRLAAVALYLLPVNLNLALALLKTAGEEISPEHREVLEKVRKIHTKYLTWSWKQLKAGAKPEELLPVLNFFHKNNQRFKVKDIGAYKTFDELKDIAIAMDSESKTQQKSKAKVEGATKIFEDGRFVLLHITTKKASACYGAGTKWCITMENEYFEKYSINNVVFYFVLDKTLPPDNPLHKVAFALRVDFDEKEVAGEEIYDAEDDQIDCPDYMKPLLAAAYKHAPQQSKPNLVNYINSKDSQIRTTVAKGLEPEHLTKMINDPEIAIRRIVAERLAPEDLHLMTKEKHAYVRYAVAKRLPVEHLPLLMADSDTDIRLVVATRIDPKYLPEMLENETAKVVKTQIEKRLQERDGFLAKVAMELEVLTAFEGVSLVRLAAVCDQLLPVNIHLALRILGEPEHEETLKQVKAIHTKYLVWALKQLKAGAKPEDLIPTLEFFHKNNQRFKVKDIGAYKTLRDLEDAAKAIPAVSKSKQKSQSKVEGAEKIVEDDRLLLLHIKDKNGSVCYGAGTKWCITMADADYWDNYTILGVNFYFVVDKSLPPDNPLHKVAFAIYPQSHDRFEIFDAEDNPIDCPKHLQHLLKIAIADAPKRPVDLTKYITSKDERVRARVAKNLDPDQLPKMIKDPSGDVRLIVCRRIGVEHMPKMMDDEEWMIRKQVADEIDIQHLPKMMNDESWAVRSLVARRIAPEHLPKMLKKGEDSLVVREIVQRIDPKYLPDLATNKDWGWSVNEDAERRLRAVKSFEESEKRLKQVAGSLRLLAYTSDTLSERFPEIKFSISEDTDSITLNKVVVPKEARGTGLGTKFMNELVAAADASGKRILLTPSKDFGATSVSRLVDFYKRFGFYLNKGKKKDFSTREMMIREPKDGRTAAVNIVAKKQTLPWQQFKKLTDPTEMHDMAKQYLPEFGRGSSRVAYRMGSSKVLKLALNAAGVGQNKAELEVFTDPHTKPFVAKIFDADTNYYWLVMESVQEFTDGKQLIKALRLPFTLTMETVGKYIQYSEKDREIANTVRVPSHPLIKAFKYFHQQYGLITDSHDFSNPRHWGKTPDGRAVYLDYGFTKGVAGEHYKERHPSRGTSYEVKKEPASYIVQWYDILDRLMAAAKSSQVVLEAAQKWANSNREKILSIFKKSNGTLTKNEKHVLEENYPSVFGTGPAPDPNATHVPL